MKLISYLDRSTLAHALTSRRMPEAHPYIDKRPALKKSSKESEICVLWNSDDLSRFVLPCAIVCDSNEDKDLLAWLSTYFRNLRPFTAHCRIIDCSFFDYAIRAVNSNSNSLTSSAAVGLIIGEAMAHSFGRRANMNISLPACQSTLSFSLAQSEVSYGSTFSSKQGIADIVGEKWKLCRALSSRDSLLLSSSRVIEIWKAVQLGELNSRGGKTSRLANIVSLYLRNGTLDPIDFGLEFSKRYSLSDFWRLLDGPREIRVSSLDNLFQKLAAHTVGQEQELAGIFAGYACSRIAPGSISHFRILAPLADHLPECFMWYCFFAACSKDTSLNDSFDGIGWFIERELTRSADLFSRPASDISLDELMVFSRDFRGGIEFRSKSSLVIEVEILPFVNTLVSRKSLFHQERSDEDSHAESQSELFTQVRSSTNNRIRSSDELRRIALRLQDIALQLRERNE